MAERAWLHTRGLFETNGGYSLGAYGLMPDRYAKLLASAWSHVWGEP